MFTLMNVGVILIHRFIIPNYVPSLRSSNDPRALCAPYACLENKWITAG